MPVCSGAELMADLTDVPGRKKAGEAAVIVIKGNASRRMVKEAAGLGVDGILSKPIVPKLLMKRLTEVFESIPLKDVAPVDDVVDTKQGLNEISDLQNKSGFVI